MRHVVMNNFWIEPTYEDQFEAAFANGMKHVENVPGLIDYDLLKGDFDEGTQSFQYRSLMVWESPEHSKKWLQSVSFQLAHSYHVPNEAFAEPTLTERFISMRY